MQDWTTYATAVHLSLTCTCTHHSGSQQRSPGRLLGTYLFNFLPLKNKNRPNQGRGRQFSVFSLQHYFLHSCHGRNFSVWTWPPDMKRWKSQFQSFQQNVNANKINSVSILALEQANLTAIKEINSWMWGKSMLLWMWYFSRCLLQEGPFTFLKWELKNWENSQMHFFFYSTLLPRTALAWAINTVVDPTDPRNNVNARGISSLASNVSFLCCYGEKEDKAPQNKKRESKKLWEGEYQHLLSRRFWKVPPPTLVHTHTHTHSCEEKCSLTHITIDTQ